MNNNLRSVLKNVKPVLIFCGVLFIPFALMYYDLFQGQFKWVLMTGNEWQFLVLPISIGMVWLRRDELCAMKPSPMRVAGILLYCVTASLYIWGLLSLSESIMELSILFFALGTSFLVFGWKITKLTAWPLLYILLSTSLFTIVQGFIVPYLQMAAAAIAVKLLNLFGFTALQNGTYFRIPGGVLNVADACSGFNQLFTLAALSIPLVYVYLRKLHFQLIIIMLAVPISIVMNGVRIMLIGIWNYAEMKENVHGPYEIFYAPFIFLTGLLLLYFITMWVMKFEKSPRPTLVKEEWNFSVLKIPFIAIVILLTVSQGISIVMNRESIMISDTHHTLQIEKWQSTISQKTFNYNWFNESVKKIDADIQVQRVFLKDSLKVQFFYAYLNKQRPGRTVKTLILPPGTDRYESFSLADGEKVTYAYRSVMYKDTGMVFWWLSNGNVKTADFAAYKESFMNRSLMTGTTESSMVIFYVPGITNGSTISKSIKELYQELKLQLPL